MERPIRYVPVVHPRCGDDLAHPWRYAAPAYRAAPHVWNVGGNDDVCAYLLDTGEGLLMIDTGYQESFYLLLDRIWRIGFDPNDIKMILLSHWHWDHINGARYLAEMSGCDIWISREDEEMRQRHQRQGNQPPLVDFTPTHFFEEEKPITLGRFSVYPYLTPGHTPGATTFRFADTDGQTGQTFWCAMHGGIGLATMQPGVLQQNGMTLETVRRFVKDCERLARWRVDIPLPSHLNQGNVLANLPEDLADYRVWIAGYAWEELMRGRVALVREMYPEL